MYVIINPRTIHARKPEYGVYDALLSSDGHLHMFNTLEDAKQYARDIDLEATQPHYIIVQFVGW